MGAENGIGDEKPVHTIELEPFLISKTEVTQEAWEKIMATTPWKDKSSVKEGKLYPATYISWHDAMNFAQKFKLRVPTEAEWECASRSGSKDNYYWGNDFNSDYAWCDDDLKHPQQVAQKKPNAFGLYDVSGNVWEWCYDRYDKNYYAKSPKVEPFGPSKGASRIFRGGAWNSAPGLCRSFMRSGLPPHMASRNLGFRLSFGGEISKVVDK